MTVAVVLLIIVWLILYYFPRQECISNITLNNYNDTYEYRTSDFKSRNDALDYCMSKRWNF